MALHLPDYQATIVRTTLRVLIVPCYILISLPLALVEVVCYFCFVLFFSARVTTRRVEAVC